MNLVDKENDVAALLNFGDKTLDTAFKLAAELGARYKRGEVKQLDFLILKALGNIARGYPER